MTSSSRLVTPGSVVDTTTDPGWTPVRVEAVFTQAIVGLPADPVHFDGPLSWGAYVEAMTAGDTAVADLPPIDAYRPPVDLQLPLATWTRPIPADVPVDPSLHAATPGHLWGWACSRAHYRVLRHDTVWVRRKPALEQMVYWTDTAKHHIGLGPRRAANIPHQAVWVDKLVWWALADKPRLETLLPLVSHIGRSARHGNGHIKQWTVAADPTAAQQWTDRCLPGDGPTAPIRAPYHHTLRRAPCNPLPPQGGPHVG